MLAYTIFVQLQSLVVISTHADRQSVDISITVCLFVNLSLLRLRISPTGIKLAASNFARWFVGVLGMASPILGNFAPPKAQNPTNRRPFWKYVLFKKRASYQRGGCPDTLDTPWIRPCLLYYWFRIYWKWYSSAIQRQSRLRSSQSAIAEIRR